MAIENRNTAGNSQDLYLLRSNLAQYIMAQEKWRPTTEELSPGERLKQWEPFFASLTRALFVHGLSIAEFMQLFPNFQKCTGDDIERLRKQMERDQNHPVAVIDVCEQVGIKVEAARDGFRRIVYFIITVTVPLTEGPVHHVHIFDLETTTYQTNAQEGELTIEVVTENGPALSSPQESESTPPPTVSL